MIVVVTGSRDYRDWGAVSDALSDLHDRERITEIRHGAAPGADALASRWAHSHGVNVHAFGAQWGTYGPQAGPIRNRRMLDTQPLPTHVVAFPLDGSRGTWQCVREARERRIQTTIVSPPRSTA